MFLEPHFGKHQGLTWHKEELVSERESACCGLSPGRTRSREMWKANRHHVYGARIRVTPVLVLIWSLDGKMSRINLVAKSCGLT